ncbi:hypothetical protein CRM22_000253 [Opisthorchis felineus]|uniref:Uncharacterized protein n=1 Tax=Opisthorchis felineus TaxID=147828 RepID=A0A4S2MM40_OPIFE|nr:hypothetical protein CRM22_000253 [Opisthorchis felineus]
MIVRASPKFLSQIPRTPTAKKYCHSSPMYKVEEHLPVGIKAAQTRMTVPAATRKIKVVQKCEVGREMPNPDQSSGLTSLGVPGKSEFTQELRGTKFPRFKNIRQSIRNEDGGEQLKKAGVQPVDTTEARAIECQSRRNEGQVEGWSTRQQKRPNLQNTKRKQSVNQWKSCS